MSNYIDGNQNETRYDYLYSYKSISSFLLESHYALNRKMYIIVRARNDDYEKEKRHSPSTENV